MTRIALDQIAFDAGTQVRATINETTVGEYAELMASGVVFPPVTVFHDGSRHYLADGFHRFMAAQRNRWLEIEADVLAGTKEDAIWFALGANRANGQRLTDEDKMHAVGMALRMWPEYLHSDIAAHVGCSKSLVSKVSSKFTSESGGHVLTGRARENQAKREAVKQLVSRGGLDNTAIADVAHVSKSFVSKVRAEMGAPCFDRSRDGVIKRRSRMREMAAEGYSSRQMASVLGLTFDGCRDILLKEGIDVPADRAVGKTKRHDSNRIVETIVADAENLTEGMQLIEFAMLDRDRLPDWLQSLQASRDKLGVLIRRLTKEQQNGQAA